ncbi:MAG: DUF72 domain-containing protein [Prochlorothrix sp.]|nr:DUF72 domain-containing protein [Prochlorothrix sp.]
MEKMFYLGCAVWAYRPWVGEFYPPQSQSRDFLSLYGDRLTAVEGNTTFYSVPDAGTVQRWVEQTPESFQFCLKLPQTCTHQGALMPQLPQVLAFVDRMAALGPRLGPMFAQLPPRYGPEMLGDLQDFVAAFPHDRSRLAIEVRHPEWFTESGRAQLQEYLGRWGVGQVLLDTRPLYESGLPGDPQVHSQRRKPQVPLHYEVTTNFTIVRFISHPEASVNPRFLRQWVQQVRQWVQQGIQVYFFVHCPEEIRSPGLARRFQAMLETAGVLVPSLPWDQLPEPDRQLTLF